MFKFCKMVAPRMSHPSTTMAVSRLLLLTLFAVLISSVWSLTREIRRPKNVKVDAKTNAGNPRRYRWTTTTTITTTRLYSEMEREKRRQSAPRPTADRPTQTMFDSMGPKSIPSKPKIVVLGATGRIGRQVVKQLLQMKGVDMTIIAFCRDYEKALKVLYDDRLLVSNDDVQQHQQEQQERRGPRLQIIEGDLVPEEELPGYGRRQRRNKWFGRIKRPSASRIATNSDDDEEEDDDEESVWLEKAESAARFYGTKVEDYDNRELLPDINESLEEAIHDATTVISAVGSVRKTNVWTDFLARPFIRILRPDVSSWCQDGHHPFYVTYMSTRKALGFAEREQLRREAAAVTMAEADGLDVEKDLYVPRIRFIRVSDLNVAQDPWRLVPLVTNMIHSLTFRYHEMVEKLLDDSTLVETVVIRPGDLVDDERDKITTAIQVSSTGTVPGPSRVGRDDVASLVVEAARMITPNETSSSLTSTSDGSRTSTPFHYTFATRWVGQNMDGPYPAQGRKRDGYESTTIAFQKAVIAARRADRVMKRKDRLKNQHLDALILRGRNGVAGSKAYGRSSWDTMKTMAQNLEERQRQRIKNRRSKPWGLCVAIAAYTIIGWVLKKTVLSSLVRFVPGGNEWLVPAANQLNEWMIFVFAQLLSILPRKKATSYISF